MMIYIYRIEQKVVPLKTFRTQAQQGKNVINNCILKI